MRCLVGLALLLLSPGCAEPPSPDGVVHLYFLDVGQGDATLIRGPSGQHVLIDAGPSARIVDHLEAFGVESIDLFIATHNDADHIGGAEAVLRRFPVRYFMDNGVPHTTATYRRVLEAVLESGVLLLEPSRRTIQLGEAFLEILPPLGDSARGHNANSIGIIFRFGRFRASLAGDAEPDSWRHWLREFPELLVPVHVHKVPHHGSSVGDIPEALGRLRPQWAIISHSEGNQHGHPSERTLAALSAIGAQILTTSIHGTIRVSATVDGEVRVKGAGSWVHSRK